MIRVHNRTYTFSLLHYSIRNDCTLSSTYARTKCWNTMPPPRHRRPPAKRDTSPNPFSNAPPSPPTSCLLATLLLPPRRWRLCQKGAQRPHRAGDDVTTNKNSTVALPKI